jgi:signal transduction histidine kinase
VSLLTWAVFAVLDIAGFRETSELASLNEIIDTSTVVVAAMVAVLCLIRWQVTDDSGDLFLGIGLLALGPVTIGFDDLVVPRLPETVQRAHATAMVRPLAFTVTMLALVLPLVRDRWEGRARPLLGAGVAITAVVGVAVWTAPTVAHVLAGRRERGVLSTPELFGQLGVAAVLGVLAFSYWRDGRARQRTLHAWIGLMLAALVQSRLALALAMPAGVLWLAGSRMLRLEALLFALMGANRELHEGITGQQSAIRSTMARVRSLEAQREAERAALEESRHDVRSALFAIGGVAELLGRSHDDLDAGTMEALTQALGAEVARLQELVAEREREELRPFSLLEAVSPVLLMERSNGLDVTCRVSERLVAVGRPKETVQVLRNLLDNARLYAPGSPVVVRGEARDEWVVIVVEDEGPGVPAAERKRVFDRSHRGTTADGTAGSGLGLYVGRRLMREQGGDLWVTDRPGGGAAFVMSLHCPSEPPRTPG